MSELRERLDHLLSYVTIYKLVVIGLLAIVVMAFPLMMNGYLIYSPLAFAASLFMSVGAAYASNRLFGWLFGVRPQADSAIITGLILVLLFSPPATILAATKIVLVAVIAMASKYILTVRGKHIFNPAAIAIVIASVSGLAYASWWIATPALLPVSAVVALLILYKTQKLTMASVFLTVAIIMIIVQAAAAGTLTVQSLGVAFTSWPLIFLAGVMLCEPLTLPPRRNQQLGIAMLVGVLMTLPLHYAAIVMTPALALVIGNAVAFFMGMRRGATLRYVSKKRQGIDGYEFVFDVPKTTYVPGQYMELSLPHAKADFRGSRRVFTIVGMPGSEQLSIATRFPKQRSTFKSALLGLRTGAKVRAVRIAGDFVLPTDKKIPILCIAGGIGITPFVTFVMNAADRDITILYGVSSADDIAFVEELSRYDVRIVVVAPSGAKIPHGWEHKSGSLDEETIGKYITPITDVYVSGPPTMVTKMARYARLAGASRVRTDHFSGY